MTKRLQKHSFYNKKDAKEDKREILELQKDQECIPEKEKVEFDFNESVKSCYQRIYAYFLVSVKDKDTADDLTQETLLTAHHAWSIGKYQEEGRFLGWIMCIAHSRLMDHFRQVKRHVTILRETNLICESLGWSEPLDNYQKGVGYESFYSFSIKSKSEARMDLAAHLLQCHFEDLDLPPSYRQVLYERHIKLLSFREISTNLKEPISTTMSRYYSAIKKLKKIFLQFNE